MPGRLHVTYRIRVEAGADPEVRAGQIAREQTVELPRGGYPAELDDHIVGRVEQVEGEHGTWLATISYPATTVGDDLPQLLNLLYGNISMMDDVTVVDVKIAADVLERFPGPRFGLRGLRELTGAVDRALIVGAIKPIGLSTSKLAGLCSTFAAAGADIIKDDHSLGDQASSPFAERVERCQEATVRANQHRDGAAQYFPNITAPYDEVERRAAIAQDLGCSGVLISPMLTGVDAVRLVAAKFRLAILTHPSFTGGFFRGFSPDLLYGLVFRIAGADGVIYTNTGGRFPLDEPTCVAINERTRAHLGTMKASLPVAGGGIEVSRVGEWIEKYGIDIGFLVGSSIYAKPDRAAAMRDLVASARAASAGVLANRSR